MAPHILVVKDDPKSTIPSVTLRPVSDGEPGIPAGLEATSTLLVQAWPEGQSINGSGARAFARWPGPVIFVPEDADPEKAPNLARIILASADVEGIQALAEWVAGVAALARSHLYLLIALEPDDDPEGGELRGIYERAQEKLAALAASLRLLGLHTNWEVRFGALGEEVAVLARTTGTRAVAVQRPAGPNPGSDFERLANFLQQQEPRLHLLVGPPHPDVPEPGNGRF